jgi:hypothetical protein
MGFSFSEGCKETRFILSSEKFCGSNLSNFHSLKKGKQTKICRVIAERLNSSHRKRKRQAANRKNAGSERASSDDFA